MAIKTLILGNSGTGKSASLRNFKNDEIAVINCAGKPLPFQNDFEIHTPNYETLTSDIYEALDETDKKIIIIDDAQYIMSFQYMRRIHENGWDKWNDIQGDFFKIIQICDYLPKDTTVYFLSHLTKDDDGNEKIKTMGKMLDEKITIEGLFTTVLKTSVQDGKYYFLTQNSGKDTVKSPIGMFDTYAINNDLKYVDARIRNYYKIGDYVSDEEVSEMAENVAAPEVEKPDGKGRKRRKKTTKEETSNEEIKEEKKQEPVAEEKTETERESAETVNEEVNKPKKRTRKTRSNDGVTDDPEIIENEKDNNEQSVTEKPKRRRRKKAEPETETM
jgi:hypothetical protein